jgi:hypothetical protein
MTQPMNQNQKELQCECHILRKCQTYKCWFVYCLAKAQNMKKNSSKKKKKKKKICGQCMKIQYTGKKKKRE